MQKYEECSEIPKDVSVLADTTIQCAQEEGEQAVMQKQESIERRANYGSLSLAFSIVLLEHVHL